MATAPRRGHDRDRRLEALGLHLDEAVRWRETSGGRWHEGQVRGSERDGSIAVTESGGSARSLPVDRLWVAAVGRRGGRRWERLTERAARCEQLSLLELLDPPSRIGTRR